jgi:hypothetical protein
MKRPITPLPTDQSNQKPQAPIRSATKFPTSIVANAGSGPNNPPIITGTIIADVRYVLVKTGILPKTMRTPKSAAPTATATMVTVFHFPTNNFPKLLSAPFINQG